MTLPPEVEAALKYMESQQDGEYFYYGRVLASHVRIQAATIEKMEADFKYIIEVADRSDGVFKSFQNRVGLMRFKARQALTALSKPSEPAEKGEGSL